MRRPRVMMLRAAVTVLVVMTGRVAGGCRREGEVLACREEGGRMEVVPGSHEAQTPPPSSLSLHCSSPSLPPSLHLPSPLYSVRELEVQGCSLPSCHLPGSPCNSLLSLLPSLTHISLHSTGTQGLPSNICRTYPRLSSLLLPGNLLSSISSLGLSSCSHLEELVLDSNLLPSLQPQHLSTNLHTLSVSGNNIHSVQLPLLPNLSLLDLSSNLLSSLPSSLLTSTPSLQKLLLHNNSLPSLPPLLLSHLDSLLLLNLSSNHLTEDSLPSLLSGQVKLIALDLSSNSLKKVSRGVFSSLAQLQILNLGNNRIKELEQGSISNLRNLHVLILSGNRLRQLPGSTLANLNSLRSLSINTNQLTDLPPGLFSDCPGLEELSLHHNELEVVPHALRPLTALHTLDLGENRISSLKTSDLNSLTKLYGLRLSGNRLVGIQSDVFSALTNLNVLNLSHNRLSIIAEGSFENLDNLRALRLDNNVLEDLNGLVSSLDNLRWLNVSTNSLQWFDFAFIPKSLEWLDIHNNRVKRIGNYYRLKTGYSLHTFDASFNRIERIESGSFLTNLSHIYLNNNRISNITSESFLGLAQLARLDLQSNQLTSLSPSSLATTTSSPRLLVSANPWLCDCSLTWLREDARVGDGASLRCTTPAAPSSSQLLVSVPQEQFLCPYQTHCQADCFCCDFFACDCRMQCPEGCSCYHDSQWTVNTIQCSARAHTDVPALIPMDATEVYLDGNNMTELINPGFIGRRRVQKLFLNSSQITRIGSLSLEGLSSLHTLHLEHNLLARLEPGQFSSVPSLRELHLQHNLLQHVAATALQGLDRLALLRMDGNLLTSLHFSPPPSTAVTLSGNPWSCSCSSLQLLTGLEERVEDRKGLTCGSSPLPLSRVDCSTAPLTQPSLAPTQTNFTAITVGVLLAILLVVLVYLGAITWRRRLKSCLRGKTPSPGPAGMEGRLFDLFLTYSLEDRGLAEDRLAPGLEQGSSSYRLCLHHRDFPPSTPLHDSVTVAAESSARTLLLLSPSYVATQWPLVRGPLLSLPPGRLLLLQLCPLAPLDLAPHPELKRLLDSGPVLRWGEARLWSSLRSLLPEPVYLTFQRSVTMRTHSTLTRPPYRGLPRAEGEGWAYYMEESSTGTVETHSTEMSDSSVRGSPPCLDHTYYSIQDTSAGSYRDMSGGGALPALHHYHTLEPGQGAPPLFTIVTDPRRSVL